MLELQPPEGDGLYIPTVGEWSRDKHYFLTRYVDAFTTSMKGKWEGLHYIDLFAGAGIERLKSSGELAWGSPMIAAQASKLFDQLHLCELDPKKCSALKKRVTPISPNAQIINEDANKAVHLIEQAIPSGTLTLTFLDPYGLHLAFETLQILKQNQNHMDLIIFFPDYLDAVRNWAAYYLENPESNLDSFLGTGSNWRERLTAIPQERQAQELRQIYVEQLEAKLGYTEFDYERISMQGRPLYSLIFCSRNEFAVGLWRRIAEKKPDGQRTFDFDKNK